MRACNTCGTTVLFGGVKTDGFTFCSKRCAGNSPKLAAMRAVPHERVEASVQQIFNGPCPICAGPGPIDIRPAYKILSVVVVTISGHTRTICCAKCGRTQQLKSIAYCTLLGWWGIPVGLIGTPWLIGANLLEIAKTRRKTPSTALAQHVRQAIAEGPPPFHGATYCRDSSSY